MILLYFLSISNQSRNLAFTSFLLLISIRSFSISKKWSTSSWVLEIDKWIAVGIHRLKQVPLRSFDLPREKCTGHISLFIDLSILARKKHLRLYQVFARITLKRDSRLILKKSYHDILFIRWRSLLFAKQDIQSQRLLEEFIYHVAHILRIFESKL